MNATVKVAIIPSLQIACSKYPLSTKGDSDSKHRKKAYKGDNIENISHVKLKLFSSCSLEKPS